MWVRCSKSEKMTAKGTKWSLRKHLEENHGLGILPSEPSGETENMRYSAARVKRDEGAVSVV